MHVSFARQEQERQGQYLSREFPVSDRRPWVLSDENDRSIDRRSENDRGLQLCADLLVGPWTFDNYAVVTSKINMVDIGK